MDLFVNEPSAGDKISNAADVYALMFDLKKADQEVFHLIGLNQNNCVVFSGIISMGGISATMVDPRTLFRRLLQTNAASFICAHNHPSGNTEPSMQDNNLTKRLKEAAKLIGFSFLDHIIIGGDGYYSYKDHGGL